jgi:hypothetical protein
MKIQFKRKKPVLEQNMSQPPAYENQYIEQPFGEEFGRGNASPFGVEDKYPPEANIPAQQALDTCLFCGSEITGSHLSVTTKSGEHCMHTSCIASGFVLLANSVGFLLSWLKEKKGRR